MNTPGWYAGCPQSQQLKNSGINVPLGKKFCFQLVLNFIITFYIDIQPEHLTTYMGFQ